MRILIVTQYFWPENFKINDLSLELKTRGHQVTILTGQPNYPEGKFYNGYSFFKPKKEVWNEIEITRIPLFPRGKAVGSAILLNYFSFVFFGLLLSRYRLRGKKFDLILVFEISPITVGIPAIWLKRKFKIPIYLWVLDLWPETLYALGIIKSEFWKKQIESLVRFIYRNCDLFLISSKSFEKSLLSHGVLGESIHYFPNWAEDNFLEGFSFDNKSDFDSYFNNFKGQFKIMFAGNLGESQDIESILKAASLIKNRKNIVWFIIGDGRFRKYLEKEIQMLGLSDTMFLLGKHPIEMMPYFFSNADAMLVSLKADPVFSLTVPAKIQTYMASKKPILSMLSGEGSDIILDAKCGLVCASGKYEDLATNAVTLSEISNAKLQELGANGYDYYLKNFSKKQIIDRLDKLFKK